jgi:hypothetical protein
MGQDFLTGFFDEGQGGIPVPARQLQITGVKIAHML